MCVQNVPFKIDEEARKQALERELRLYEGLGLSTGFVPLCAPKWVLFEDKPLTVRCPMCGIVMDYTDDNYYCLECGIINRKKYLVQTTLGDFCD